MSHHTRSLHDAPFSPLFSPSQESSPQPSNYSRSPSPTPIAHRAPQQPGNQHRASRPTPTQYRTSPSAPPSDVTVSHSHPAQPAYYHSDEPPPSDVDVLLSPSFSLPLSNSDNSAPHSPSQSPSPQLQSPFTPRSPAHSSASASTSASTGGPLTLQPWQLALFHSHYPQLSQLNLSHNRLVGLCSFHSVAFSLLALNLSYNVLPASCLPHLASLTALEVLSLAYNNIDSLSLLPLLPSLASIDLSSNCLSLTPSHLTAPIGRSLPQLQRLSLSGNPFCSADRGYRLRVIHALRECTQLAWLDGLPLEEERRGLGDRAAEHESKEQLGASDSGGGERQTGPRGTERKRGEAFDEADSKYDTTAVPFPQPGVVTSSQLLFKSPFDTPQHSLPTSNSKNQAVHLRNLSSAPVTHYDVDVDDDDLLVSATTATPLAPAHPAPVTPASTNTTTHSATVAQPARSTITVASPSPHPVSLSAFPPQQPAASLPPHTLFRSSQQEMRIAALEAELKEIRAKFRPHAAAATMRSKVEPPQLPTSEFTQSVAASSTSTSRAHPTRPLQPANDVCSVLSNLPAPSPLLSSPPVGSSTLSSSSLPSSYSSLLLDLRQSRQQCDELRSQVAGLQHVVTLQEQSLSARLNVDTDGLVLWRHAVVQLVKKQREDEEQRERMVEEKKDADRRWQHEKEQKAVEVDGLRRTAERAREEVWKREDELSHMRVQQSQAKESIERLQTEKARQASQLQGASAGLAALRASQQSIGTAYERAERMLAATSARLHFACQRVSVIAQLRVLDSGGRVGVGERAVSTQSSSGPSRATGSSVAITDPPGINADSLHVRRELDRLRQDNAMLLHRHTDAVNAMRSEQAKAAADSAARLEAVGEQLNTLRAQYQAAMDDKARLTDELSDARGAVSRHQADLVEKLDNVRREGERHADERCERLRAELKKALDDHAALQREAVASALELRRMHRALNKVKEDSGRAEEEKWRTAEEELRRRDARIERLEREKEDTSRRWRQMLPQSIVHQPNGSLSSSGSSNVGVSVSGTGGQVGSSSSAKLHSLAALSMQLLQDDSDD